MITRAVRFDFKCQLAPGGVLTFIHHVPSILIRNDAQSVQMDPRYINEFTKTMLAITKSRDSLCRAASSPYCENCGAPMAEILHTPMSYLHKVHDPFVVVWTNPVCGKPQCESHSRQAIQTHMRELTQVPTVPASPATYEPDSTLEVLPCSVCGKTDNTKRCARCRVVAYCGREHQKAHWQRHKKGCVPSVEGTA